MSLAKTESWKAALDQTSIKYHVITLWVAVVFNLLFFVTDYINVEEYWREFLSVRVVVSAICLVVVLFYRQLKITIPLMGFIPVLLISVQNAYMWSVMDVTHLQTHTLAYMALFIGSGMFVFYPVFYSVAIVLVSLLANVLFFYFNSNLLVDQVLVNGGLLVFSVALFSILLIRMRFRLTKKELIARYKLEASKHEIQLQNQEIVASINYAKRIQHALIPPAAVLKKMLPQSFVVFKPKDIVSGDFYWVAEVNASKENEKNVMFAVADCTGHGVPGAFMSLIGLKILDQSIQHAAINSPAQALDFLNDEVYKTVNQHVGSEIVRDGMDIALCSINYNTLKLTFSGAHNPIYIIRNQELHELKGDRQPIGSYQSATPFSNQEYQLKKGDMLYAFTDGYADQFGGEKGKKLKYKPFKQLLLSCAEMDMDEQKTVLGDFFEEWRKDVEQIDDVCVIGVRF